MTMDPEHPFPQPAVPAAAGFLVLLPGLFTLGLLFVGYATLAPAGAPLNSSVTLTALFVLTYFSTVGPFDQYARLLGTPRVALGYNLSFVVAGVSLFLVALLSLGLLVAGFAAFASESPSSLLRFWVPVAAAALAIPVATFVERIRSGSMQQTVRGRSLLDDAAAERAAELLRRKHPTEPKYTWGGKQLPGSVFEPNPHFLFIGTAGSGKTALLKALMRSVLTQRTGGLAGRAMVYDPKLELYPYLLSLGIPAEDILVLNPYDLRARPWNLGEDIQTHADARQLAVTLLPLNPKETQPYFTETARAVLEGAIIGFLERKEPWELRDLIEAVSTPERLQKTLLRSEAGTRAFATHLRQAGVTSASVVSSLQTPLSPLATPAYLFHRARSRPNPPASIRGWMASKRQVILLAFPAEKADSLRPLYCTFFRRAVEYLLQGPEKPETHTWFFFDEARDLRFMEGLEELLARGRSKGAHVVLGFQDVPAAKASYDEQLALSILAGCQNLAALRVEGPETSQYLAARIGNQEYRSATVGSTTDAQGKTGTSLSTSIGQRQTVMPEQFMTLPSTTEAGGIPGFFTTPAIGAWGPTLVPFAELGPKPSPDADALLEPNSRGFLPVPPADEAPVYWTQREELSFLSKAPDGEPPPPQPRLRRPKS